MSREKLPENEKGARDRVPFGGPRRRLSVPVRDDGFVYHWFNDVQDRIERAKEAGYEHVTNKMLKSKTTGDTDVNNQNNNLNSAVSKRVNETLTTYLMRIKEEYWKEDFALKQEAADAVDEAIFGGGSSGVPNSYGLDVKYRNHYER
jgi:hypothetical protein